MAVNMNYIFNNNKPIYQQIIDHIKTVLASGEIQPGSRIPSVRELALEFGVNPNTVQKALHELERDGFFHSERTSGRFVTDDKTLLAELRSGNSERIIARFVSDMTTLGMDGEKIIGLLTEYLQRSKT